MYAATVPMQIRPRVCASTLRRPAPANARSSFPASLHAVPFPVGARFETQLNVTHDGNAANLSLPFALAFVRSSAFLAVPSVRAAPQLAACSQLAGHCPKTLPRPAAKRHGSGAPRWCGSRREASETRSRTRSASSRIDAVRACKEGGRSHSHETHVTPTQTV